MNLVPNEQLLLNVSFQPIKYRKEELCVDNKVKKTIGNVYCPTSRNEKCVYISTNKTTSFYHRKKCKKCCHVLNIPFKDQKPTILLFGAVGTHCFARKTSHDHQKENHLHFWRKFPANHNQAHPNLNQKKVEVIPFIAYSCRHPNNWFSYPKLHLHYHFIHFQSILIQHYFLSLQRW